MADTHPEFLVDHEWLHAHLADPTVVILDVTAKLTSKLENRAAEECWAEAHIPGSVPFDVASGHGVLSDPDHQLPWMWPEPDQIATVLRDHGVGPGDRVVLVASTPRPGIDSGTMWCTRAWWTLHASGVGCAILRGGLEGWRAAGLPLESGPIVSPQPAAETPAVTDGRPDSRAQRADVEELLASGSGACLIDALGADSFDGSGPSYGPRAGHITGAVNVPFRSLLRAETADFVDPAEMRQILETSGALSADRVVTYCGGAIAATVTAFCLTLLGRPQVSVYDGSLMEWSADPTLPMSTDPGSESA